MVEENRDLVVREDMPIIADDSIVAIAEQAEKRINAVNKIKVMALKVTNNHDWMNQQGKPYLQVSGAEKVARLFGISWRLDEPLREDEEGGHFIYTYKGHFSMGNVSIEAIGTRSSKDGFFKRYEKDANGKKTDIELPASEIDKSDVKKAAFTNCLGNGITRLLGFRNLSWEELEKAGINVTRKVEYKQSAESSESKDLRQEIRKMVLEMNDGNQDKAKIALQEITSYVPKGKTEEERIKGKQTVAELTDKQLPVVYGQVKKIYEEWQGGETEPVMSAHENIIIDFIVAMETMATIEACDKLLGQVEKAGVTGEGYTKVKMARDKRVSEIKGVK